MPYKADPASSFKLPRGSKIFRAQDCRWWFSVPWWFSVRGPAAVELPQLAKFLFNIVLYAADMERVPDGLVWIGHPCQHERAYSCLLGAGQAVFIQKVGQVRFGRHRNCNSWGSDRLFLDLKCGLCPWRFECPAPRLITLYSCCHKQPLDQFSLQPSVPHCLLMHLHQMHMLTRTYTPAHPWVCTPTPTPTHLSRSTTSITAAVHFIVHHLQLKMLPIADAHQLLHVALHAAAHGFRCGAGCAAMTTAR